MNTVSKKHTNWTLPALLVLFLLQVITIPYGMECTWAAPSTPTHVLTYEQGKLTWDKDTAVDANGTALLAIFHSEYDGSVVSDDETKVVAPGTGNKTIVRLANKVSGPITYKAVLYRVMENEDLAVLESTLSGRHTPASTYPLPAGVLPEQVIHAVGGTVQGKEIRDLDVDWMWKYYIDSDQDLIDTALGDLASEGKDTNITLGLYIVVEDNNSYYVPQTGDDSPVAMYATLLAISTLMLILLWREGRKERKCAR